MGELQGIAMAMGVICDMEREVNCLGYLGPAAPSLRLLLTGTVKEKGVN